MLENPGQRPDSSNPRNPRLGSRRLQIQRLIREVETVIMYGLHKAAGPYVSRSHSVAGCCHGVRAWSGRPPSRETASSGNDDASATIEEVL